ncbi:MAG: response regulator, partial [Betaproteobacteria bacterium]|nr:response regulator [Betaproteobacteria bacterium]
MSKLPILRQHFFANLPSRVVKLEVDIKRFFETADIDLLHPAYVNAHNLAGSGSMFGCPEISEAAHNLEAILASLQNTQPKVDEYIISSLTQALQTLQKSVTDALTHFSNLSDASASDEEITEFHTRQLQHERLAYIVEDDLLLAKNLAIQLSYFGYQARIFDNPQSLVENTDGVIPAAIIMDIVFPAGGLSGLQLFANNIVPAFSQVPLIFISGKNDFQSRLEAARAGGAAYFPKPIDIGALINTLDSLTAGESPIPYRVLVIDDDEPTARYHANLLQLAG